MHKSKSSLESARILLKAGKIEESVSLSYYAMYNCLLALLFKCGIKSENHSASISLLKELFHNDDAFQIISFGKKERVDKQYYIDFKESREDAIDMADKAEEFRVVLRLIMDNLQDNQLSKLRKELEESLHV